MKKILINPVMSGDWFYMNETELSIRDIYNCISDKEGLMVDVWEDAGVLEISYTEKNSIDFELLRPCFKDKEGQDYLEQNKIKTLFMVTFPAEDYTLCEPILKFIVMKCKGYFIEDNMDFSLSNRIG